MLCLVWFPNASESALAKMVQRIVEPFLSLFRKIPLQFGGLDFTVMFALLALSVVERFVLNFWCSSYDQGILSTL